MSTFQSNDQSQFDDGYDECQSNEPFSGDNDSRGHIITTNDRNNDNNSASYDNQRFTNELKRNSNSGLQDNCDLCLICETKIYPMEKLNADGKLYHKNCFRCSKCRTILSITNFNVNNNSVYCKTHFMELFKLRGRFDDNEDISHEIVTGTETEDIPTIDTKGLLAKFRELESGSAAAPQPVNIVRHSSSSTQRYTRAPDDIVKHDDIPSDELPAPETAKAMVAMFKAMESNQNVPSPISVEKMQQKAKANATPNANVRLQTVGAQASVNEDEFSKEQLPEEGTTKNLLSKFQQISESN